MEKNKRYILLLIYVISQITASAQNKGQMITGRVTDGSDPLPHVNILVKNSGKATETDAFGKYSIKALPQDVIIFTHIGMQSMEIIVEDITSILNIKMVPITEELQEVVVKSRQKKTQKILTQDFANNKELVRTVYGILDTDKAGFTVRVLDGDDLKLGFVNILDVLQARFPGVYLKPNPLSPYFKAAYLNRTKTLNKEIPLLFDVDGVVTPDPPFIPITEVDRLALISGVGGTVRYGTRGAGGVAVINTKNGALAKRPDVAAKLGIRSFSDSEAIDYGETLLPKYLSEFRASKSLSEATVRFKENMIHHDSLPYFYIDAYAHFSKQWNHQQSMKVAMDSILSKFGDNAVVLKALAYNLETAGDFQTALHIYQKVFDLRPSYEQSFRDVAHAYHQIGDTKTALRYYMYKDGFPRFKDIDKSLVEGIDFTLFTEMNTLLANNDDLSRSLGGYGVLGEVPTGTRILFEWNNGEAEFDIQFVNPERKYFTWSHTLDKNQERILDEKLRGYSSEQFFIDASSKGNWQINLTYLGNKSFDPTYLKVTVWTNFGTVFQNKMIKLFRFEEEYKNYKLFAVMNNPLTERKNGK